MQPSKETGQSPSFLTYGSETILPADIMWKSPRVEAYQEGEADKARQLELDSVEEARCWWLISMIFTTNIPSDFMLLEPYSYNFH